MKIHVKYSQSDSSDPFFVASTKIRIGSRLKEFNRYGNTTAEATESLTQSVKEWIEREKSLPQPVTIEI